MKKSTKYLFFGWLICGLGAAFYSYEYFLRISPSVMETELRQHFNLSAAGFGLLSSFYYYAYVPMQIPVGVLMDRFGPKRLLMFACIVCVAGTYLFASTDLVSYAAFARFLVGFGSSFAFVGVLKLATIWLPEDKLGMVAGLAAALGTIGAMIGDNMLGEMVSDLGWQKTVNATGLFGVGLLVVMWFGLRDQKDKLESGGTIDSFKRNIVDLKIIARNKQIWINGLYGCFVYLPTTVFAELWGIPYLRHAQGLTEVDAHLANSMVFLGFAIGAPLMGFISDSIRRRKLPMLVGASVAAVLMMVILYWPNLGPKTLNVLLFLLGLFYSSQAIVFAVGRELSPKEAGGTSIAMTNMIVMIGAMVLQPLVGQLLDWSLALRNAQRPIENLSFEKMKQLYIADDYQFALCVIPLGILIGAILTFCLKETHAHAENNPKI